MTWSTTGIKSNTNVVGIKECKLNEINSNYEIIYNPTIENIDNYNIEDKKNNLIYNYIKDENKWEKDDSHIKIDKSIQDLTMKQMVTVKKWEEEHPNYLQNEQLLQEWHSMIQEIMGKCDKIQKEKNELLIKKSLSNNTEIKEAMIMDEVN